MTQFDLLRAIREELADLGRQLSELEATIAPQKTVLLRQFADLQQFEIETEAKALELQDATSWAKVVEDATVFVEDEQRLDRRYLKPNLAAIKRDLVAGREVAGAILQKTRRIET